MSNIKKFLFLAFSFCCLLGFFRPELALLFGLGFSLFCGPAIQVFAGNWSAHFLKFSIVLMGAGVSFAQLMLAGKTSVILTLFSILATLALGYGFGRLFKVPLLSSFLLSVGTAICGGSAILAVSIVLNASRKEVTFSLLTVFLLNSLALLLFPQVGELLSLSADQFAWWSAIAIHDTSSVVGAAAAFSDASLQTATVIKLTRALWIVPLTLIVSLLISIKRKRKPLHFPWFILGFIAVAYIFSSFEFLVPYQNLIFGLAKNSLVLSLFLIGVGFEIQKLKEIPLNLIWMGASLWICVSIISLLYFYFR